MKKIEISLPTKWKDIRDLFYYHGFTKRAKHNNQVLSELRKQVCNEINSRYWRNDISEYMKSEVTQKIEEMFITARMKLK